MNSKKSTIIATLLIVAAILIGFQYSPASSSPTTVGQSSSKELEFYQQSDCFFISGKTMSDLLITGQSKFTIIGSLPTNTTDTTYATIFKGHMEVAEYPLLLADGFQNFTGSIDDTFITLTCQGLSLTNAESDTWYTVQILRSAPQVCVIKIWQKGKNSSVATAVCGTNETDALNNYTEYINCLQTIGS